MVALTGGELAVSAFIPSPTYVAWLGRAGVFGAILLSPLEELKIQLAPLHHGGNCCSHLAELFVIMLPDLCWIVSCQATNDTQILQKRKPSLRGGCHDGTGPGGVAQDPLLEGLYLVGLPFLFVLFILFDEGFKHVLREQVPKVNKVSHPDPLHQGGRQSREATTRSETFGGRGVVGFGWVAGRVGTPGTSRPAETVVKLGAEEPVLGPGRVDASATAAPGEGFELVGVVEAGVTGGARRWTASASSFCCRCIDSMHCTRVSKFASQPAPPT